MRNRLLLLVITGLMASCRQEIEPEAATPAARLSGTYQTNGFLDVLCIALPSDKMPVAELRADSDSEVTVTIRRFFPAPETKTLKKVALQVQNDQSVWLLYQGKLIGSYQTDRIFTSSGMEIEGNVLRINKSTDDSQQSFVFTGYKP